jgi:hypothetical protein
MHLRIYTVAWIDLGYDLYLYAGLNYAIWLQVVLSIVPALGLDVLCAYVVTLTRKAIISQAKEMYVCLLKVNMLGFAMWHAQ